MRHLIPMAVSLTIIVSCAFAPALFAQPKAITLVTDPFEPYYGDRVPNQGFVTEIAREALKRSGYDLTVEFMTWNRAMELSRQGKYAGVLGAYYSEERNRDFVYSVPIARVEVMLMSRKGANIAYTTLEALKAYRIGIIRGYANTDAFDSADFLIKDAVEKNEQNLKKLITNRVDLVINSRAVLQHVINTAMPWAAQLVEFVEPPLQVKDLHIMFTRKDPNHDTYVNALDRGYGMIKTDGALDKILARHGFK
ncbi:MAG: transporter substrate-binding domain-containing protein [Desulfobacteraceae bacterium]|nr:transporter substrate-binding domain-containing protein [Desulfobacteraceae bacterium]